MRTRSVGYQVEVAVETAAESPCLVAVAAQIDKTHSWEARLDECQSVCQDVYGIVYQRCFCLRHARHRLVIHNRTTTVSQGRNLTKNEEYIKKWNDETVKRFEKRSKTR